MNINKLWTIVLLFSKAQGITPHVTLQYDHPLKQVIFSPNDTHLIALNNTTIPEEQLLYTYDLDQEQSVEYSCLSPTITNDNFCDNGHTLLFPSLKTATKSPIMAILLNENCQIMPPSKYINLKDVDQGWKFFFHRNTNTDLYASENRLLHYVNDDWHQLLSKSRFFPIIFPINNIIIAPDNKHIAIFELINSVHGNFYSIRVYAITNDTRTVASHPYRALANNVKTILFNNQSKFMISAIHNKILVKNLNNNTYDPDYDFFGNNHALNQHADQYGINTLALSPNGERLAAGLSDGLVSIFRLNNNAKHAVKFIFGTSILLNAGRNNSVEHITFSPNGKLVAGATTSGKIYIWDLEERNPATTPLILRDFKHAATWVAFSSDSQSIVASSANGEVCVWDI